MLWPWKTSSASTHQHEICVTDWHMHWVVFISCWLVCYGLLLQFASAGGQHAQAEASSLSEAHLWQGTLALASLRKPFCCSLACHTESWPLSALGEVYAKCNAGQWEFPCSRAGRMHSKVEILLPPFALWQTLAPMPSAVVQPNYLCSTVTTVIKLL